MTMTMSGTRAASAFVVVPCPSFRSVFDPSAYHPRESSQDYKRNDQKRHRLSSSSSSSSSAPLLSSLLLFLNSFDTESSIPTPATLTPPSPLLVDDVLSPEDIVSGIVLAVLLALLASFLQGQRSQNDLVLWNTNARQKDDDGGGRDGSGGNFGGSDKQNVTRDSSDTNRDQTLSSTVIDETFNVVSDPSSRNNDGNSSSTNNPTDAATSPMSSSSSTVFGAKDWEQMSQPENYVWYNTKLRQQQQQDQQRSQGVGDRNGDESGDGALVGSGFKIRKEKRWVVIGLLVLFVPVFSFELGLAVSRQFLCGDALLGVDGIAKELCVPHG